MKLFALALALALSAPLQDTPPEEPADPNDPQGKLEAWPELTGQEKKQVQLEIQKLRKARTEEMAADAVATLAEGPLGAMPLLLTAYAKEKEAEARGRLASVMERLTDASHTRALAGDFGHKERGVRTWCLRRAAIFPDQGLREAAGAALARVAKDGPKADPEERYAAALCATSTGALDGLGVLREWALESWPQRGAEMRAALAAARGPEATAALAEGLSGERAELVAGLRLLSAAGDESAVEPVAAYLDSDDNQVRVAAINALRGIVDGEGPMENLSVFRAIEMAKAWKLRVAR